MRLPSVSVRSLRSPTNCTGAAIASSRAKSLCPWTRSRVRRSSCATGRTSHRLASNAGAAAGGGTPQLVFDNGGHAIHLFVAPAVLLAPPSALARNTASGVLRLCARLPSVVAVTGDPGALTGQQGIQVGHHATQLTGPALAQLLAFAAFHRANLHCQPAQRRQGPAQQYCQHQQQQRSQDGEPPQQPTAKTQQLAVIGRQVGSHREGQVQDIVVPFPAQPAADNGQRIAAQVGGIAEVLRAWLQWRPEIQQAAHRRGRTPGRLLRAAAHGGIQPGARGGQPGFRTANRGTTLPLSSGSAEAISATIWASSRSCRASEDTERKRASSTATITPKNSSSSSDTEISSRWLKERTWLPVSEDCARAQSDSRGHAAFQWAAAGPADRACAAAAR